MLRVAFVLAISLGGGPALADCPVASDLDRGIRFTVQGGDSETFKTLRPGIVEAIYTYSGGGSNRTLLAQGVYLLELADSFEPGRTTYVFPVDPGMLPVPTSGGTAHFDVLRTDASGMETEGQSYDFGPLSKASFGTCSYSMMPVTISYQPGGLNDLDTLHYLPDLGIAYLAESTFDGQTDRYRYTSIEAMK